MANTQFIRSAFFFCQNLEYLIVLFAFLVLVDSRLTILYGNNLWYIRWVGSKRDVPIMRVNKDDLSVCTAAVEQ